MSKTPREIVNSLMESAEFSSSSTLVGIAQREYLLRNIMEKFSYTERFNKEPLYGDYIQILLDHGVEVWQASTDQEPIETLEPIEFIDSNNLSNLLYGDEALPEELKSEFVWMAAGAYTEDLEEYLNEQCAGCVERVWDIVEQVPFEDIQVLYDGLRQR